jgi:hypothetical protein
MKTQQERDTAQQELLNYLNQEKQNVATEA